MIVIGQETAADWARFVREDQPLSGGEHDTEDFLYVEWRAAADREGSRWAEALRGVREMREGLLWGTYPDYVRAERWIEIAEADGLIKNGPRARKIILDSRIASW